jgi:hypothetical protein
MEAKEKGLWTVYAKFLCSLLASFSFSSINPSLTPSLITSHGPALVKQAEQGTATSRLRYREMHIYLSSRVIYSDHSSLHVHPGPSHLRCLKAWTVLCRTDTYVGVVLRDDK